MPQELTAEQKELKGIMEEIRSSKFKLELLIGKCNFDTVLLEYNVEALTDVIDDLNSHIENDLDEEENPEDDDDWEDSDLEDSDMEDDMEDEEGEDG